MTETALSERDVYTARPTVRLDGAEDPGLSELVLAMVMTEAEGGMSALELRLKNVAGLAGGSGDADLAFDADHPLNLGAALEIYGGDEAAPQEIFRGQVTGLEGVYPADGAPEVVVLAEDVFQRARMTRRTKVHENASIADLARQLASSLSLEPIVAGFSDKAGAEVKLGTQVQLNESDLAFLRRLLARHDGDLQVVGRALHVSPRADVQRAAVGLRWRGQLKTARVLADLAHQVTEVTTSGWDVTQGCRVTGKGTGAHLQPGRGRTGAKVLVEAIGPRAEHVGHLVVADAREAQAVADALFDRRARRFLRVEATAVGNPAIRVGSLVELSGLGRRFDNTYYVVRAVHRYDGESGYETEFEAECAFLG